MRYCVKLHRRMYHLVNHTVHDVVAQSSAHQLRLKVCSKARLLGRDELCIGAAHVLPELDGNSNWNSTCTDFSTFTTFKSLGLGADKQESVDVDAKKVEFAPPPWLNRHFCCQVHWFRSQYLQISDFECDLLQRKLLFLICRK